MNLWRGSRWRAAALFAVASAVACVGEIKKPSSGDAPSAAGLTTGQPSMMPGVPASCPGCGLDVRPGNATCRAFAPPPLLAEARPAFPGLGHFAEPTALARPATGNYWYVLERAGVVRRFEDRSDVTTSDAVYDMQTLVDPRGDAGLVAVAFHPNFAQNGQLFISYTALGGTMSLSQIARITSTDGGATFTAPADRKVILEINQEGVDRIHLNADLKFGPDGFLYTGFGDGGPQADLLGHAQNMGELRGKILRVDIDHGDPYQIPADNPFVATTGARGEIWAVGLRNPWRFTFDSATGDLWAGDVGFGSWEEVDKVVRGGNYGWPAFEGSHCIDLPPGCAGHPEFLPPVVDYAHNNIASSVTGGFVYHGHALPSLVGRYVYGDYSRGTIFALRRSDDPIQDPEVIAETGRRINSFAEETTGELLMTDLANGEVLRLVAAEPSGDDVPTMLSATGCFHSDDPKVPNDGLLPYDVRVSFWSDGAIKQRYLALPDGMSATVASSGVLQFPVGSVLVKQFLLGDKPVETRLFMKYRDSQWAGYSYIWNDDGLDATLDADPAPATKQWDGQSWNYPSREECLGCHNSDRGLGLEVDELDMTRTFATGRIANQLATLRQIGIITGDVPAANKLAKLESRASTEQKARSYLHVNCSICHAPNGPTPVDLDFRVGTAFADMHVCSVAPREGDLGVAGATRLTPGKPEQSIISVRMHTVGKGHMPPIGPQQTDGTGMALIDAWISGVPSCN